MRDENVLRLFWFSPAMFGGPRVINFGDELSNLLISKISGREVRWINPQRQSIYERFFSDHVLGIGSILHFGARNSKVWGSGLMEKSSPAPNCEYFAVRGPFTRTELVSRGFKVPEIYGDPGLLAPDYFPKTGNNPIFKLGIIPHYSETEMIKEVLGDNEPSTEILLINLREPVEEVIKDICDCSMILSSSLHGIIVAHAYGIPALRVAFTDKILGDGIKYRDYFASVGIEDYEHLKINHADLTLKYLLAYFETNCRFSNPKGNIQSLKDRLIASKPF